MKYIIVRFPFQHHEMPIIFSDLINHKKMADYYDRIGHEVVSAGKVKFESYCEKPIVTHGSQTLGIEFNTERNEVDHTILSIAMRI